MTRGDFTFNADENSDFESRTKGVSMHETGDLVVIGHDKTVPVLDRLSWGERLVEPARVEQEKAELKPPYPKKLERPESIALELSFPHD